MSLTTLSDQGSWSVNLENYDIFGWADMAVAHDGSLMLINMDSYELVFLDSSGKEVARTGSKGQGPEEFSRVEGVGWWPHQKLFYVLDHSHISYFNAKGKQVKRGPVPNKVWLSPTPGGPDSLFDHFYRMGFLRKEQKPSIEKTSLSSGETTILWETEEQPTYNIHIPNRVLLSPWSTPFFHGMGSDFIAVSYHEKGQIEILSLEGKPVSRFEANLPQWPLDREEAIAFVNDHLALKLPNNAKIEVPDFWPMVKGLLVDDNNRTWIYGNLSPAKMYPFKVFNKQGRLLGEGSMKQIPAFIRGQYSYLIGPNDDDEHTLVKTALPKLPEHP